MTFTSLTFVLIFLPVFLLVYYKAPDKWKDPILFGFSMVFYGTGEPVWLFLLFALAALNYLLYHVSFRKEWYRAGYLITVLLLDLIPLCLFKCIAQLPEPITGMLPTLAGEKLFLLPIGISFYTFQLISFQVDHVRAMKEREKTPYTLLDFWSYAACLCMFFRIEMGPIVRMREVCEKRSKVTLSAACLEEGLRLFTMGLAIKLILADKLASLWNGILIGGVSDLDLSLAWLGAITFSMQLYFDFWGYSLMAVGIGKCCGYSIPRNFKNPYWSLSVSEVWRRWHVTLGKWFRDYVYIPLGGNRKGGFRTALNLMVIWILTGIWHGNGLNFLIWGAVLGGIILLERFTLLSEIEKVPVLRHIYVLVLMPVTWMIFAWTDLDAMLTYLQSMLGMGGAGLFGHWNMTLRFLWDYAPILILGMLFITPFPANLYRRYGQRRIWNIGAVILLILCIRQMAVGQSNPFMYLQF